MNSPRSPVAFAFVSIFIGTDVFSYSCLHVDRRSDMPMRSIIHSDLNLCIRLGDFASVNVEQIISPSVTFRTMDIFGDCMVFLSQPLMDFQPISIAFQSVTFNQFQSILASVNQCGSVEGSRKFLSTTGSWGKTTLEDGRTEEAASCSLPPCSSFLCRSKNGTYESTRGEFTQLLPNLPGGRETLSNHSRVPWSTKSLHQQFTKE